MSSSTRRAVLTGVGVISPIGLNTASFWESLRQGHSGVRRIQSFDTRTLPVQIGGEIVGFDARNYIDKKERRSLKVMARTIQLAVAAAQIALDDSKVNREQLDPERFGVEFGAGLIATELEELGPASQASRNCLPDRVDLEKWGEAGLSNIQPLWMLKYLPNMLACHVSILHNAQGPNNTITETDVAGLLALGEAYRILQRDQADYFLVGGADSKMNPLSLVRQCLFTPLSRRNDAPEKASRPFDFQRDGIVLGEGAAVFALEELEHARRRAARVCAEVAGFGAAFDRERSGRGISRAIRAALDEAGIGPEEVDHVNAHGLSTLDSDAWEARGLQEVFGSCRVPVPVLAPKSYFGNLGAGSGPAELAASVLALQNGLVPATLNYEQPDPDCSVTVVRAPQPLARAHVLKISFTELGQCAALVLRKWE
jgi:3-oxoacyl-[acyl-carrier-protein] synthase II